MLSRFVTGLGGSGMSNRFSRNHSLWPEQARPHKAKQSALAISAFCIGAVAAISAHNVLTELSAPAYEPVQQSALANIPVYATAPAPGPTSAGPVNSTSSPLVVAKLPSISTPPAAPGIATDGRGGATDGRGGEAPANGAAAVASPAASALTAASASPIKTTDVAKAADEPLAKTTDVVKPADEPSAKPAEPAAKPAARERPARTVQKDREHPNNYARNRNGPFFPFFGFGNGSFFGQRG